MRVYKLLFLFSMILSVVASASASPVTYNVTVNTSALAGTTGSLDLNFNPGPLVTQAASVQVLSFTSNGSLVGIPATTGDAAGTLPGTITFDNATGYNDYFEKFKYGSALSFSVSLYGSALSSPDGTSTSGSTFAFSMFSDSAGTIPVLTTDTADGFAYTVNVNLDGTTTATNYIPQGTSPVPEPSGLILVLSGMMGICKARRFFKEKP